MRLVLAVSVLSLFAVSAVNAADELIFRQHYEPDHRYHQTLTTSQEMTVEVAKQKEMRTVSTTMGMVATVKPRENKDGKDVEVRYDSIKASLVSDGQKFAFDSNNPDTANAGPLMNYSKVIGQQFKVIYDER